MPLRLGGGLAELSFVSARGLEAKGWATCGAEATDMEASGAPVQKSLPEPPVVSEHRVGFQHHALAAWGVKGAPVCVARCMWCVGVSAGEPPLGPGHWPTLGTQGWP